MNILSTCMHERAQLMHPLSRLLWLQWMSWQAVGPDPAAWDRVDIKSPSDAFTTLHPGLFAGGGVGGGQTEVMFDYFRWVDNEVWPSDEV